MTVRSFDSQCPHCGAVHDSVTAVDSDVDTPREGTALICAVCGEVAIVEGETTRQATAKEAAEVRVQLMRKMPPLL